MTLSELQQGESAVIIKIRGRGVFQKRLTEMGFVRGHKVTALNAAPLKDPIVYHILSSNVSLRRSEANLIDVLPWNELNAEDSPTGFNGVVDENVLKSSRLKESHTIDIVLVGNPNAGKTSIFNAFSGQRERTGNYSGVTVDAKTAIVHHQGYTLRIADLPGTYSISAYTQEESFVRKYLFEHSPDIVINVIDASNLERNLFLTTQLIDMDVKVIVALNMFDELEADGDTFDYNLLGEMIGIPFIPTVGHKGKGIRELFDKVVAVFKGEDPSVRHVHIHYGEHIEQSIKKLQERIKKSSNFSEQIAPRYYAIKLLEKDKDIIDLIEQWEDHADMHEVANKEIQQLETHYREDSETTITNARYGFIAGALKETYVKAEKNDKQLSLTERIDHILVHKFWGYPIFLFFVWLMFFSTFFLGAFPMSWIEKLIEWIAIGCITVIPDGFLQDMMVNGIVAGVGGVIVFLPNILILFFFISIMESTGYMARVSFLMDKLMHRIGLHGKSFIPLIMGFGCNVPAIMATRTLANQRDRLLTMLILPFMSCSARLPVFILIIGTFFPDHPVLMLLGIYLLGVILSVLFALLFKRTLFRHSAAPFVMELPPYRVPTGTAVLKDMWIKAKHYLKKMGGIILVASVAIWMLGYFPQRDAGEFEKSYIAQIGKTLEPMVEPLGFDWKMGVSLLTGTAAKEIVVSTMGVLYAGEEVSAETLSTRLKTETHNSGKRTGQYVFSPLVALSFLVFILVYFPCVAVVTAVGKESGSWKWALFLVLYTTAAAWILSFLVFQIGSLLC